MTPKEKAEYLVELYQRQGSVTMERYVAKQCALIAVDEVIEVCNLMDGGFSFGYEIQFWQQVKNEIFEL